MKKYSYWIISFIYLFFSISTIFAQNGVGINTATPKSNFEVNGSSGQKVTTITATTTLDATYNTVICNNGASAITVTLPAVAGCTSRVYTIKREASSTANVTIDANASETIDGALTLVLTSANQSTMIVNNGTEWKQISSNGNTDNLLFPMGEMYYFDVTGTNIGISAVSNGSTNMVLCNPTTTNSTAMEFDSPQAGRLRYKGTKTKMFHIACTITFKTGSAGDQYVFGVAQNGSIIPGSKILQKYASASDVQSTAIHIVAMLATDEYLELYVGNMTSTADITVHTINMFALGMGM